MTQAQNGRNLPAIRVRQPNPLLLKRGVEVDEDITENLGPMLDLMDRSMYVNDFDEVTIEAFQRYSIDRSGQFAVIRSDSNFEQAERVSNVEGIYLGFRAWRRYFENVYDPDNPQAPSCVSMDGVTGVGSPGGDCNSCQFGPKSWPKNDDEWAVWKKRGQRSPECGDRFYLFLQPVDSLKPAYIDFPATSRKVIRAFQQEDLRDYGVVPGSVVINVALKKEGQTALFQGQVVSQVDLTDDNMVQIIGNSVGYVAEALQNQKDMHLRNELQNLLEQGLDAMIVDGKVVIRRDSDDDPVTDGYFDLDGTWQEGDPPSIPDDRPASIDDPEDLPF